MSTTADLYAAIIRDPTDLAARLAYADALEETGSEADLGRAKFVRLQMRIAAIEYGCSCGACVRGGGQHHNGPCAVDQERDTLPDGRSKQAMLRILERQLLGLSWGWIGKTSPLHSLVWTIKTSNVVWYGTPWNGYIIRWRRGFIDGVACQLQHWLTNGPTLVRHYPITNVSLTDRNFLWARPTHHGWLRATTNGYNHIPPEVFQYLQGKGKGRHRLYDTEYVARDDLSQALLQYARNTP